MSMRNICPPPHEALRMPEGCGYEVGGHGPDHVLAVVAPRCPRQVAPHDAVVQLVLGRVVHRGGGGGGGLEL